MSDVGWERREDYAVPLTFGPIEYKIWKTGNENNL